MTENEAIQFLDNIKHEEAGRAIGKDGFYAELMGYHIEALNMAIKALEQKPCNTDTCKVVKAYMNEWDKPITAEPKTGHCKDCKWWKDSDGVFRRGIGAESQCPMNRIEVFEGNGYCYMYEPQESEDKE